MEVDPAGDTEEQLSTKLQLKAADMLIRLKDECYSTEKVFNLITKGVDDLHNFLIRILKCKFLSMGPETILSVEEVCSTLSEYEGNSLFQGLQTPDELSDFIAQKRFLVKPEVVEVTTKELLQNNKLVKKAVQAGFYIPFLPMLECLLNCPEVLNCVDNPKPVSDDSPFIDALDSDLYNNHPIVKKYPGTLAIRTYDDDALCTDTASNQRVSVRFAYWTLLNIYPELRASNQAIHLLSCAETEIIKASGHKRFWQDFVTAMKQLCSEQGVSFDIMGQKRTFRAVLVSHIGDNPACASIGGFKESHFANCACRQCLVTSENMYTSFNENDFTRRTKETHEIQLAEIEEYVRSKSKEPHGPSVQYGINSRSILMDIPHCDVTKCLPQDLMHDVLLGTMKQEIVCLLLHVLSKKTIKLSTINERISELAKFFGVNKPAPIEMSHLEANKLHTSASETLALAHLLPFALVQKSEGNEETSLCDKENLDCYILRLDLLKFEMSDEFSMEDIEKLKNMIADHHRRFQKLYPDKETPKFHYETHFPSQILLHGSLRLHWCMRYEGKHAYFKRLCRLIHNFTNICKTLAMRHQEKQCGLMLLSSMGNNVTPYLRSSDKTGAPRQVIVGQTAHKELLCKIFEVVQHSVIQQFNFVDLKGVHYKKSSAIVTGFVNRVPICGEVVAIYGYNEKVAFVYTKLNTQKYERTLNSFKVKFTDKLSVILASDLAHRHHVPFIKKVGANYIILTSGSYLSTKY